jgi:hypothetical protein
MTCVGFISKFVIKCIRSSFFTTGHLKSEILVVWARSSAYNVTAAARRHYVYKGLLFPTYKYLRNTN